MNDRPELPFIDQTMTTIVFYGIDRKLPVREAKTLIENICRLLDETPSHAHVGLGDGKKSRGPKWGLVDKAIAKGDFDDYSYIEAVNYFDKHNVRDCCLEVAVINDPMGWRMQFHYQQTRKRIVDVGAVLKGVLKFAQPQYGMLYSLTAREGPFWFASGGASSGMPEWLSKASSEFRQEYLFGKKFSDGFFRDVFRWNYLGAIHLDKVIEGVRFQDWIELQQKQNDSMGEPLTRGRLTVLDSGSAVWELTKEEIAKVRLRMLGAGLLMVKS